ncbi:hypothetical protein SCUP515_12606 [Seiridium cupressi]
MNASANPDLSNGTCYSSVNTTATGDFIPCGNVALGHWPCCLAGDFCLSFDDANACWDLSNKAGNTYLAGCTDLGFNDKACPWKSPEFEDQEWVGLIECDKGTGKNDTQWGGCKAPENSTELVKLPHQSCDPYCTSYIFEGGTALPAFASLPNSTGSSIAWTNSFAPTLVYAPVTTTAEVSGTKTTITSIQTRPPSTSGAAPQTTTTSPTPAPASGDGGLSTGAKVGIGVGIAGAALLALASALIFLLVRRRKKKQQQQQHQQQQPNVPINLPPEKYETGPPDPYQNYQPYQYQPQQPPAKSWPNDHQVNEYAVFKSELPANERPMTSELPADHSTMPHSSVSPQHSPNPSTASPPHSSYAGLDSPMTDQLSSYSESTTIHGGSARWITPEHTGGQSYSGLQSGRSPGNMGPVAENDW